MGNDKKLTRREALLTGAAVAGGGLLLGSPRTVFAAPPNGHDMHEGHATPPTQPATATHEPGQAGRDYTPVITPDGASLPWKIVDGVKVYHLIAEEVEHEFAPGLRATTWGYNGRTHGPTIEAVEGDRVRIYVTNRLDAPTTVHWHGILLPNGMDGVGGLNQRSIDKGETFKYEFTLRQHGTFMYHSHHDEMTQMGMGMMGMIVVHPRLARDQAPFRGQDFAIMLSEWAIKPGTRRPDPNVMSDFNILTMNAKAFPGTSPLVVRQDEPVRIRFGNLSAMDHHPIHLHGYNFKLTETDGGVIPEAARWPMTTVLVEVGSTKTIEFIADAPGDWAMHCHMTHHVMNQMGHGIPNMIGVKPGNLDQKVRRLLPAYMTMGQHGMGDMGEMGMAVPPNSIPMVGARGPFDYITMGGMFTIVKVRHGLTDDAMRDNRDPGWYTHPHGTMSDVASEEELIRDGVTR
jgi:FtsP/CotA-like multicopper oxidase with cupredoxin domain